MERCPNGHTGLTRCPNCGGTGKIDPRALTNVPMAIAPGAQAQCPNCLGSGLLEPHSCRG
jgi:DnaJ-class molecular chaperone